MQDQQPNTHQPAVDQSDRRVPVNLRQSGSPPVELLLSTQVRKSPYWHLSMAAGCWRATVYNRMYQPRGYLRPEHGGAMAEYQTLTNHVALWDMAVQRQIQVRGPQAEGFVNFVITRDATHIVPMDSRYVILCNEAGRLINDPMLLRLGHDEFWFSIADADLLLWLQGVNVGMQFDVQISEIDVAPVRLQGPKATALMVDLLGSAIHDLPDRGLLAARIADCQVVVSRTDFAAESGYEIYLYHATHHAEALWNALLAAGERHRLRVIAPPPHRRIAAGVLTWGQDMDSETVPFQVNLGYQVPRDKRADYLGKEALETMRERIEAGDYPYSHTLVGILMGGKPVLDHAADFWLISAVDDDVPCGYVTSPWYSPELGSNIALAYVPVACSTPDTRLRVWLPGEYQEQANAPVAAMVVELPFGAPESPDPRAEAKSPGRVLA